MCCFSQRVISVSSTNIFARAAAQGRQILVYSMSLEANNDLAMILPLPAQTPAGEKDVQFVDLKGYPQFFDDLRLGFPIPPPTESLHMDRAMTSASKAPLEVVQVGDFEASFVPAVKDFSRLDERFRLPDNAWKDLPAYADYGFAVFKLKSGAQRIHPMAFSFLNRDNARLFFPTVHIHDGKVHGRATFDHALYCQPHGDQHLALGSKWEESTSHARRFMKLDKSKSIIEPDQHCYRRELRGSLKNQDTFISVAA